MRDPRVVRMLGPSSSLRYALLKWRRDRAAWYVEEVRDELSEIDDLADALEAREPGVSLATMGFEGNRRDVRRLKAGPLPADVAVSIRVPRRDVN